MEQEEYQQIIEQWKEVNKIEIEIGKAKKIFLEILPTKIGFGKNSEKLIIDWKKSKNYKVKGIFGNSNFEIQIMDYEKSKKNHVLIKYNDKEFEIYTDMLKKCRLSKILKDIKPKPEFKYMVGKTIKDNKRDITIIDRKKIQSKTGHWMKYYRYKCNKCGFNCGKYWDTKNKVNEDEYWILEQSLTKGNGCACCCHNPQIVAEGINDILTTAPWMIPYIGEECAKIHTHSSNDKVQVICSDCGKIKNEKMQINTIYSYHSIRCDCSDKISYPEKFMFQLFKQLDLNCQTQLSKTTFNWCQDYKYDFYLNLNGEDILTETHGRQHYEESFSRIKSSKHIKTLEEEQENDKCKKELALSNGIKEDNYIVIDCRYSKLEWIKNSILESRLNKLFDLSNIDWLKCEEFAVSNLVKVACELKRDNSHWTTQDIGQLMKIDRTCITVWLKRGNKIWDWCNYNPREEMLSSNIKNGDKLKQLISKPVEIFKNNISQGIFESATDLERQSEKLFGTKLLQSCISLVCQGKQKYHKDYTFKYISKEEYELRKSQENLKQVI